MEVGKTVYSKSKSNNQSIKILDEKNEDHLWEESMRKEMKEIESLNTIIIQDSKENMPNDFQFILVRFLFDVKYC